MGGQALAGAVQLRSGPLEQQHSRYKQQGRSGNPKARP
jgi:hypothetical protein